MTNFDSLFPDIAPYIKHGFLRGIDRVEPPVRAERLFEHIGDGDETSEPEANTPDGLIPNSYIEDGVRKVVVWDEGTETRYKLINGHVLLEDKVVF